MIACGRKRSDACTLHTGAKNALELLPKLQIRYVPVRFYPISRMVHTGSRGGELSARTLVTGLVAVSSLNEG